MYFRDKENKKIKSKFNKATKFSFEKLVTKGSKYQLTNDKPNFTHAQAKIRITCDSLVVQD